MLKRVLVTGASRGIGRAIAIRLANDGWTPLIHYNVNRPAAEATARESGGVLAPFGANLASPEECDKLWDWAASENPVTGLVNNAGIYRPAAFTHQNDQEFFDTWREHFDANFFSALRLSRKFVLAAIDAGITGAKVLNVCSRVGFKGEDGAAAYAASKAAQINLTRSLAIELAPINIGVFGIAPGWVETAMARPGMEARLQEILSTIPLGRVATPEDCAEVAAFLMRDEAAYLSGVVIDINGASYFH